MQKRPSPTIQPNLKEKTNKKSKSNDGNIIQSSDELFDNDSKTGLSSGYSQSTEINIADDSFVIINTNYKKMKCLLSFNFQNSQKKNQ